MKKMILYVLCIATCACLSGCKSSQPEAKSDKPDKEEKKTEEEAQGILFSIENKRDRAIQVFMDSLAIEGQPDDILLTASTVPAHATGVYFLDIYTYNPDYLPDDITAFDGVMFTQIATGGNGDRFQVTLSPESED